jgi:hypothetical protein
VRDKKHIHGHLINDSPPLDQHPLKGYAGESAIPISPEMIVPNSLSLIELVPLFHKFNFNYFFVLTRNDITHVTTFYDFDKLPMKLCLFSLCMELESLIIALFLDNYSEINEYINCLTKSRLDKAKKLCKKKYKKETPSELIFCTTFIDKKEILLKTPNLQKRLPFKSKRQNANFFSRIERVRNQIAHGDSILEILNSPKNLNTFIIDLQKTIKSLRATPTTNNYSVKI